MGKDEQRVNIWFSDSDIDITMALNKMSLEEERSKNWIIKNALKNFLRERGFLNDDFKYIKQ